MRKIMKRLTILVALLIAQAAQAVPLLVEDTINRFELTFDNDDTASTFPVGATGGRGVEIFSGGESAAIAISVIFRSSIGALEDLIFIFEGISTDPFFPDPANEPGDVMVFSSANGFAGADGVFGDGLLPGFISTELTVVVGPTREDAFFATLVLSNAAVPEPSTLGILGIGLVGLCFARKRKLGDRAA
jgi:hypothetical protein